MTGNFNKDFLSRNILLILALIFIWAIVCLGIAAYFYFTTFNGEISSDHERWGTFGDFFGGSLSPIFSLLALLALLLTIILQNKELEDTRKEFEKSSAALQEQSASIKIQNFENTFFKLISLYNEIVDSLIFQISHQKRSCFREYIRQLELTKQETSVNDKAKEIPVNLLYNLHYDLIAHSVEHYHKNLYQIMLFIDNAEGINNKKQYSNFIRSQLSRDELHMLFLHGLSKFGYKKFRSLIERYELLEHLPKETFLLSENMYLYDVKAFGDNSDLIKMHAESKKISKFGSIQEVMEINEK